VINEIAKTILRKMFAVLWLLVVVTFLIPVDLLGWLIFKIFGAIRSAAFEWKVDVINLFIGVKSTWDGVEPKWFRPGH